MTDEPSSTALVPRPDPEPHADAEPEAPGPPPGVFGCPECGALYDTLPRNGQCTDCQAGVPVALGGDPNELKARALVAWARRDATHVLEARGTLIGAVAGGLIGVTLSLLFSMGIGSLFAILYFAVLGAVVGHLTAIWVHGRVRPQSRLQPIIDGRQRLWLRRLAAGWLVLPVLVAVLWLAMGPRGSFGQALRAAAGRLMAVTSQQGPAD